MDKEEVTEAQKQPPASENKKEQETEALTPASPTKRYPRKNVVKDIMNVEKFADMDDVDLSMWQRNMKVNKFMLDVGVRNTVQELIEPVVNS